MIEERIGDPPRRGDRFIKRQADDGARRGEAFAPMPAHELVDKRANASPLLPARRPLWLRLLGVFSVVLLLALAGAGLGRGFGAVTPAAVIVQTVAPAAVPTAPATQAAAAPAPVLGAAPTARPADPAPAAIPVPAATPVVDASAAWPVQLAESFDQASQSWPEVLGPSWWSRYHDGGYEMALAGRPSMSYSSPLPAHDFWLAADVRVARGRAGLFFLLGRPNDFYRFLIDAEGRYRLEWQQVGYARPLIDWTASDALRPGDRAINQIAVRRVGDVLRLYANGTLLGSYDLPLGNTLEGRAGLALDAPDGERAALAWFDNLEVRAPDHK